MKDFKYYLSIDADPEDVYACLTNPFTIELWSDMPAKIEAVPGAEFEILDGGIVGKMLEVESNKKVVQQWYFGDQKEPSIVTILIRPDRSKVSVEVKHTNIPDQDFKDITEGWKKYYLGRIKEFLEIE